MMKKLKVLLFVLFPAFGLFLFCSTFGNAITQASLNVEKAKYPRACQHIVASDSLPTSAQKAAVDPHYKYTPLPAVSKTPAATVTATPTAKGEVVAEKPTATPVKK
jgi:hypothetical protein